MLRLHVSLLSGKTVTLAAEPSQTVSYIRQQACEALVTGKGRLLDPHGRILCDNMSLSKCDLQDNDHLTLQLSLTQVCGAEKAFAAILADGSVHVWGDAAFGGDSSLVRRQLRDVVTIRATATAFAALLADGSVVTWGERGSGGDSQAVQNRLANVREIQAGASAFAAILHDGSVVTWGELGNGGISSAAHTRLPKVQCVQMDKYSDGIGFAAIASDGSLVEWGANAFLAERAAKMPSTKGKRAVCIQANREAFAAILDDASVVTWGCHDCGGDSSMVESQLQNVCAIQSTCWAFAALRRDGTVVTWGRQFAGRR